MKTKAIVHSFIASLLLTASPFLYAKTYMVTSNADTDGNVCAQNCTLRQAINAANLTTTPDNIKFDLDPLNKIIELDSPLPKVTQTLHIDGKLGDSDSDSSDSSDDIDRVVLDGKEQLVPSSSGMLFFEGADASHSSVKNLQIQNMMGRAIRLDNISHVKVQNNVITNLNNFIVDLQAILGNIAIELGNASKNIITNNVITRVEKGGIYLFGASDENKIEHNDITLLYKSKNLTDQFKLIFSVFYFNQGILLVSSPSHNLIQHNRLNFAGSEPDGFAGSFFGIQLVGSPNNKVAHNQIKNSSRPIYLSDTGTDFNIVSHNHITRGDIDDDNPECVELVENDPFLLAFLGGFIPFIKGDYCGSSTGFGINLFNGASFNKVKDNRISGRFDGGAFAPNVGGGIISSRFEGFGGPLPDGNIIQGNTLDGSKEIIPGEGGDPDVEKGSITGIVLGNAQNHIVKDNVVFDYTFSGIQLGSLGLAAGFQSANDNLLKGNTICNIRGDSSSTGVLINDTNPLTDGNTFKNTIFFNNETNIVNANPAGNIFINNQFPEDDPCVDDDSSSDDSSS